MKKPHMWFGVCVVSLMLLGLVILLSASSTYSNLKFANPYHLFSEHSVKLIFAAGALVFGMFVSLDVLKQHSRKALLAILIVLFVTAIIATQIKGAKRWVSLGFTSFQPSDFAKIILPLYLGALLEAKGKILNEFKQGYLYPFLAICITAMVVLLQPNISNGMMILLCGFFILFYAGARLTHLLGTFVLMGAGAFSIGMLFSHVRERVDLFLHPEKNDQVIQALIGLGTGQWLGVGFGNSNQRNLFLPESYGDFIFAVYGEERGYIGVIGLVLLYIVLFLLGLKVAQNAKDTFSKVVAFGYSFLVVQFALVHIAVTSGFAPTTGLPLPFISHGGSSLVSLSFAMGVVINIGRHTFDSKLPKVAESAA